MILFTLAHCFLSCFLSLLFKEVFPWSESLFTGHAGKSTSGGGSGGPNIFSAKSPLSKRSIEIMVAYFIKKDARKRELLTLQRRGAAVFDRTYRPCYLSRSFESERLS